MPQIKSQLPVSRFTNCIGEARDKQTAENCEDFVESLYSTPEHGGYVKKLESSFILAALMFSR